VRSCDAIIVGGGPAGSTCAWALTRAGFDVVVMDRAKFPRDKVCAGWVTPPVVAALEIDPRQYAAAGLVIEEVRGFRTSAIGGREVSTRYDDVVSYTIRRSEFDNFLLRRSGAEILDGTPVTACRKAGDRWIVNDAVTAPMLVGAGGHFCPIARPNRAKAPGSLVVAKEAEFRMPAPDECSTAPDEPELFFCRDLDGYGWAVRKGAYLNVGLGRRDDRGFGAHLRQFVDYLRALGRIPRATPDPSRWCGHAYLLAGAASQPPVGDGYVLVGDSAGLAYRESGEGIRPAVESALAAAQTIIANGGRFDRDDLEPYAARFSDGGSFARALARVVPPVPCSLGRALLAWPAFTRLALDRWFLRSTEPTIRLPVSSPATG
jgi:geranylgeranyl reductase family protein